MAPPSSWIYYIDYSAEPVKGRYPTRRITQKTLRLLQQQISRLSRAELRKPTHAGKAR